MATDWWGQIEPMSFQFIVSESGAFIQKMWWLVPAPIASGLLYDLSWSFDLLQPTTSELAYTTSTILDSTLLAASTYWTIRFLALGHDVNAALSINWASAKTFLPFLATMATINACMFLVVQNVLAISIATLV